MTGDAKTHLEFHARKPVHALHVPVAPGTIEFCPGHVGTMMKKNKIGGPEDTLPRHGPARIEIIFFFLDLGMLGNDVLVTEETFLYLREPRILGPFYE